MSHDLFVHSERELVASLGLTQKAVRAVRSDDLDRTVDWETVGGEVRYSDVGRARLLAVLKISAEAAALPSESDRPGILERVMDVFKKNPAAEVANPPLPLAAAGEAPPAPGRQAGDCEDLVCQKCYVPNRRIVEAKTASGAVVLVRVKDNGNLRPGMVMKCRYGGGPVWELAQRLPRLRGKW